jgi:hypothetical protein
MHGKFRRHDEMDGYIPCLVHRLQAAPAGDELRQQRWLRLRPPIAFFGQQARHRYVPWSGLVLVPVDFRRGTRRNGFQEENAVIDSAGTRIHQPELEFPAQAVKVVDSRSDVVVLVAVTSQCVLFTRRARSCICHLTPADGPPSESGHFSSETYD